MEKFKELLDIFERAPVSQVDPSVVDRILLLREIENPLIAIEVIQNIQKECVYFGLCSDFVVLVLEQILNILDDMITQELLEDYANEQKELEKCTTLPQ